MVAVHQEYLANGADESEEWSLEEVGSLAIRVVDGADTFDGKIVADADMEVGLIGGGRGESPRVKIWVAGLRTFGVGVALDGEDEGGARSALGGESRLCALREVARAWFAVVEPVKIFCIRRETIDDNFCSFTGGQLCDGSFSDILIFRCTDFEKRFHR